MHKPIATTVHQFEEPDKWATSDYTKNTATWFYVTNMHLNNLAKDLAPLLIWHNERSTELFARIAAIAPAQNQYGAGTTPKHANPPSQLIIAGRTLLQHL